MSKIIVITGASSGIGEAAARRLYREGHCVVLVGRSPERTRVIADELGSLHFVADFENLADVRRLASDLTRAIPRIDVLANNAGGAFGDRTKTVDGLEKTLQVNHLAPYLLTRLLMDRLVASRAGVIQTTSDGARLFGKIVLDDLNHDRDFSVQLAYGSAKLANILFTTELHRRYADQGLSSAAFHPGFVATNFASQSMNFWRFVYGSRLVRMFMTSPDQGADQLVWLATTQPGEAWHSGTFYDKRRPARRTNPQALDADLTRQLWDRSEELVSKHLR